jgi:hypothetical protein
MHLFEKVTGVQAPGRLIVNENRDAGRPKREPAPESVLEVIRSNSGLDLELYEFARQLFLRDLALCGPAPAYRFVDHGETVRL